MKALCAIALVAVSGCQTVKVNGYEVTGRERTVLAIGAVAVGAVIISEAGKSSPSPPEVEVGNPGYIECQIWPGKTPDC